jgi:hypothetical protein
MIGLRVRLLSKGAGKWAKLQAIRSKYDENVIDFPDFTYRTDSIYIILFRHENRWQINCESAKK